MTIHRALMWAACAAIFTSPIFSSTLFSSTMFAQSPKAAAVTPAGEPTTAALPAFQLVDVHVSPHSDTPSLRGGISMHGDRHTTSQATMTNLIARSFNVESCNRYEPEG